MSWMDKFQGVLRNLSGFLVDRHISPREHEKQDETYYLDMRTRIPDKNTFAELLKNRIISRYFETPKDAGGTVADGMEALLISYEGKSREEVQTVLENPKLPQERQLVSGSETVIIEEDEEKKG